MSVQKTAAFIFLTIGCVLFLGISCSTYPKPDPIVTPLPTRKMAQVSGVSYRTLQTGYRVYSVHCALCHQHQIPNTTKLPEWHAKIATMADRAGLSQADEQALQTYLDQFTDL